MIVKGVLSFLGSGATNTQSGFSAYNSIGFADGQELMVDQSNRIAAPAYLADKLSLGIGKNVEISLTNNKRLITAVKIDGRVYKIDSIQPWMTTVASTGLAKIFNMLGWVTIVFPPLFVLYLFFGFQVKSEIVSAAKAFD